MKNRSSQMATSLWKKMAFVLLGLILSLVLLELGMRLGGFVLLSIQEYGNLQSIKQKGAYRILCLGESTTQGEYPKPLEKILNQRNIGVRFSVIDKGRDGVKTFVLLGQVESYLDEYHPDMVVAMMGINDGGSHMPLEAPTTSGGRLFIRSFRVYKLMRFLWRHLLTKAKEMEFCKPAFAQPISAKDETPHPKTEQKETSAEAAFTEDNPKNDDVHFGLWRLYLDQGKLSQAEASLRRAIEVDPKNFIPYFGFGWFYLEQGKLPQAEASFRKAIELNPKCNDAYVGLGELFFNLGQLSKAESLFKKAVEINPRDVMAFSDLGRLYRDHGKLSQAEDSYRRAFEIDPKNERALRAMISLYEEMGKPDLAKEYVQKMAELRLGCYSAVTINSYRRLKEILDRKGIKLVCMQYPMRDVEQLKRIFGEGEDVIFLDNERVFKEAVKRSGYKEYFRDMSGGDFGHCTPRGNELLARNIAGVILREVFHKR